MDRNEFNADFIKSKSIIRPDYPCIYKMGNNYEMSFKRTDFLAGTLIFLDCFKQLEFRLGFFNNKAKVPDFNFVKFFDSFDAD